MTETRKEHNCQTARRAELRRVNKLCAAYLRRSTPRARIGVTDTRERAARETGRRGTGVERPGALWVEREGTRPRDEPGLSIVILVRYVL